MAVAACASTNRASEYCVSRLRRLQPFLLWYGLALVFTSPKTHIGRRRHYCSGYAAAGGDLTSVGLSSVLARNEEFSKIAVIKFFVTVLKKKIQLSVGGILRGNVEIYHANQQFSTCRPYVD